MVVPKFRPPEECPVYHPSEAEFADPMQYIASIEHEARKYGLCRIVPPASFKPPFAADFDVFKFAPRIQLLHTLDGIARLRFSFNQSLRKFWQIFTPDYEWIIPEVNGKIVDYLELHKAVESFGGYDAVCAKSKWIDVARKCQVITAADMHAAAVRHQQQQQQPVSSTTTNGNSSSTTTKKRRAGALSLMQGDEKSLLEQSARYLKGEYDATVRPFMLLMRHADPECLYIFGHRGVSTPSLSVPTTTNSSSSNHHSNGGNSSNGNAAVGGGSSKRASPQFKTRANIDDPTMRRPSRMGGGGGSAAAATRRNHSFNGGETAAAVAADNNNNTTTAEAADDEEACTTTTATTKTIGRGSKRNISSDASTSKKKTTTTTTNRRVMTRSNSNNVTTSKSKRDSVDDDDADADDADAAEAAAAAADDDNLPVACRLKRNRRSLTTSAQQQSYSEPTVCAVCFSLNDEDLEELRQCDKCDLYFHEKCLGVCSDDYPKNCAWYCLNCLREKLAELEQQDAVGTDIRNYGFEYTKREYTLREFNNIADTFKAKYFHMQQSQQPPAANNCTTVNTVPAQVEQEFWKLMQWPNPCEMIYMCVLYGADLRREMGSSGFPIHDDLVKFQQQQSTSPHSIEQLRHYVEHPWNLNNLPLQPGSVLKHIPGNISGMKVPWKYAGACFSAFCWHNEDHWTYSINFNHLGEVKTWYGVPGEAADKFEEAFRKVCPELLRANSDLLHQITTHLNPNLLQKLGVPVYRTNQYAGNFIITFPRAYHAGFNHGFNFAEAVNFCLASWVDWGRRAIDNYSRYKRLNVFAHDEMILHCALNNPSAMHVDIKKAVYKDLCLMVRRIQNVEATIGVLVPYKERVFFEHVPDEERQCEECCTTCFLVGIVCSCLQQSQAGVQYAPGQMTLSARSNNTTSENAAGNASGMMRTSMNSAGGNNKTHATTTKSSMEGATEAAAAAAPAAGGGGRMGGGKMSGGMMRSSATTTNNGDNGTNGGVAASNEPRFACAQHTCIKCQHDQMVYKYRCSFAELRNIAQRVRALITQQDADYVNEHDDYIAGKTDEPPTAPQQQQLSQMLLTPPPTDKVAVLMPSPCAAAAIAGGKLSLPLKLEIKCDADDDDDVVAVEIHQPKIASNSAIIKHEGEKINGPVSPPATSAAAVLSTLTPTSSIANNLSSLSVQSQHQNCSASAAAGESKQAVLVCRKRQKLIPDNLLLSTSNTANTVNNNGGLLPPHAVVPTTNSSAATSRELLLLAVAEQQGQQLEEQLRLKTLSAQMLFMQQQQQQPSNFCGHLSSPPPSLPSPSAVIITAPKASSSIVVGDFVGSPAVLSPRVTRKEPTAGEEGTAVTMTLTTLPTGGVSITTTTMPTSVVTSVMIPETKTTVPMS